MRKKGTAIVYGAFGMPGRDQREKGVADAFDAAGFKTVRIVAPPEWNADPHLGSAPISAAILANPNVSVICFPGGQILGAAPNYLRAANKKPGEIKIIGFDLSPEVIRAFKMGYVQLTSDQQPFLQGYLPVLSLCQQLRYDLAPLRRGHGQRIRESRQLREGGRAVAVGRALMPGDADEVPGTQGRQQVLRQGAGA